MQNSQSNTNASRTNYSIISYSNITEFNSNNFSEYLSVDGYSHSYLKSEVNGVLPVFVPTKKVEIGKIVDAIITGEFVDMSSEYYPYCRDIANKIKSDFGAMLPLFKKQVNNIGTAQHAHFEMKVKGRLDFLLPKQAVIDLKVTSEKDIPALIKHMGYENQMWNYCKLAKVNKAFLMVYSIPLKQTKLIQIDCSTNYNDFWADKIFKFGTVKQ